MYVAKQKPNELMSVLAAHDTSRKRSESQASGGKKWRAIFNLQRIRDNKSLTFTYMQRMHVFNIIRYFVRPSAARWREGRSESFTLAHSQCMGAFSWIRKQKNVRSRRQARTTTRNFHEVEKRGNTTQPRAGEKKKEPRKKK